MHFDVETGEEVQVAPESTFNLDDVVTEVHQFEKIIGNQLICVSHSDNGCPRLTIKPTEVLERNDKGELELVDKMPR